tara:strand:+ start:2030 stop:2278 length:249 start_codon:yes stop_codon:yes gene_type:complete
MTKTTKIRAQVKSRFYYIFWGTATVAVVAGQIYVGSGFRRMAETLQTVLDAPLMIEIPDILPPELLIPMPGPRFYQDEMVIQ